jgi:hypothetical protein
VTDTTDLDATIKLLNGMLEKAESLKDKLAVTDRLQKFYALRLKHSAEGKGGKFSSLPDSEGTT